MTKQASDIFLYEDFEYDLLDYDGKGLINPRDFGMEPEFVETDCYAGFISNYEITKDGLFLTEMQIANTINKYSTIQGIKPKPLGERSSYVVYQQLRLFTPYTGIIQAGRRYTEREKELCKLLHRSIKEYKEVTEFTFDEGMPTYGKSTRDDGLVSSFDFFDSIDQEFEYLKNSTKLLER
ncbi:hypothetical protein [Calothrix sp. CCY 0018]|uniref:hypothetical protein n=1 Tax=Calothrix sp. CCY 0018 TaxID=3103864 RepID=UPI0039C68A25